MPLIFHHVVLQHITFSISHRDEEKAADKMSAGDPICLPLPSQLIGQDRDFHESAGRLRGNPCALTEPTHL